jgi:hypothetical protein
VCETGGGRRAWLRGQTNVSKVHTLKCAAYNLGLLLRKVWGLNKPRNAAVGAADGFLALLVLWILAAVIAGRTMNPIVTWWLAGCGWLVLTIVAYGCTQFIRGFRERCRFLERFHKSYSVTCIRKEPLAVVGCDGGESRPGSLV